MEGLDFKKYEQLLIATLSKEQTEEAAVSMIGIIGRNDKFNPGLVKQLIKSWKKSERVLTMLGHALGFNTQSEETRPMIEELIKSDSINVRMRAYEAYILNFSDNEIISKLQALPAENDAIVYSFIKKLFASNKISREGIAEAVIAAAKRSRYVLDLLLDGFESRNKVDERFVDFLEEVISRQDSSPERGYVIHLLGREKGYDFLFSNYGISIKKEANIIENIAIALSYLDDKNEKRAMEQVFSVRDQALNVVEAAELAERLKENRFGNNFLELCVKNLWK